MNFENDGKELKFWLEHNPNDPKTTSYSRYIRNYEKYLLSGFSFNDVSSGKTSFRYQPTGFIPNARGPFVYSEDMNLLGYLNSKICLYFLNIIAPTLTYNVGDVKRIPYYVVTNKDVERTVVENISFSRADWDSFETSWDFQQHPLVALRGNYEEAEVTLYQDDLIDGIAPVEFSSMLPPIQQAYEAWERLCDKRFYALKANEEELNRIFIDIYGLQGELTPEVEDKDVTVRKADLQRDIKSLISYAVGCIFGRYSLDRPGLAYAGGEWEDVYRRNSLADENRNTITFGGTHIAVNNRYQIQVNGQWRDCTYSPDVDNIIPICDDEYFDDDIVARFVKFIEVVYGKDTLEENLKFIADALGGKGQSKNVIRSYFLNDFYADHCKIYQKRPIYWLFDSGKKNGFKALIYMHRYQPDTIARIRTDYVHEQQSRYRTAIADLEQRINGASTSERVKLSKQLTKLQAQADEIRAYEEKIHHLADQMIKIDLDDGVKHNYEIFKDVLAKIK